MFGEKFQIVAFASQNNTESRYFHSCPGKLLTYPRLIFQKSYSPSRKGVEETIMLGNEVGFHGMTYAGF